MQAIQVYILCAVNGSSYGLFIVCDISVLLGLIMPTLRFLVEKLKEKTENLDFVAYHQTQLNFHNLFGSKMVSYSSWQQFKDINSMYISHSI